MKALAERLVAAGAGALGGVLVILWPSLRALPNAEPAAQPAQGAQLINAVPDAPCRPASPPIRLLAWALVLLLMAPGCCLGQADSSQPGRSASSISCGAQSLCERSAR